MSLIRGYVKQTIYQKIPVQIYKHKDTKHRYPPLQGQCARRESELSIFRYTWVKLTMNPPTNITLNQNCTWYTALHSAK